MGNPQLQALRSGRRVLRSQEHGSPARCSHNHHDNSSTASTTHATTAVPVPGATSGARNWLQTDTTSIQDGVAHDDHATATHNNNNNNNHYNNTTAHHYHYYFHNHHYHSTSPHPHHHTPHQPRQTRPLLSLQRNQ